MSLLVHRVMARGPRGRRDGSGFLSRSVPETAPGFTVAGGGMNGRPALSATPALVMAGRVRAPPPWPRLSCRTAQARSPPGCRPAHESWSASDWPCRSRCGSCRCGTARSARPGPLASCPRPGAVRGFGRQRRAGERWPPAHCGQSTLIHTHTDSYIRGLGTSGLWFIRRRLHVQVIHPHFCSGVCGSDRLRQHDADPRINAWV